MTRFEFATAGRVVFGAGARQGVGEMCRTFGRTALVVIGRTPERSAWLWPLLDAQQVSAEMFAVSGEPSVTLVQAGVSIARDRACDVIVAVGGGSVIDTAKAIATLVTNPGDPLDYLEVVGRGQPLPGTSLPVIAVPTTAGTGSEVTRNAVLTAPEHRVKVSLRSPSMLPRIALVDPELTLGLPPALTATTGLDALTQLIEPYVSSRATPMTDALCLAGIRLVATSLRTACRDGRHVPGREAMSLASLWGGMALANAGLGAVHGLAGPIGGMFDAPHGGICAALLPHVCAANIHACRALGRQETLARFVTVARILTDNPAADADAGVAWLRDLVADLGIPALRTYGLTSEDVPAIVAQARHANSMKANPVELPAAELSALLAAAL